MKKPSRLKKYGYFWVTFALFAISLSGHWLFSWFAYSEKQKSHAEAVEFHEYFVDTMRDTLENWQSEFLQLIWQVGGLTVLWCVGSPSSKEGDERKEEKLDVLIRRLDPEGADRTLRELEEKYPKK